MNAPIGSGRNGRVPPSARRTTESFLRLPGPTRPGTRPGTPAGTPWRLSQPRIRGRYRAVRSFQAAVSPVWARISRLCRVSFMAPLYRSRDGRSRGGRTFWTDTPFFADESRNPTAIWGEATTAVNPRRPINLTVPASGSRPLNHLNQSSDGWIRNVVSLVNSH